MKAFTIYLTFKEEAFLKQRSQEGYKISSYIRRLLEEQIKKEGDIDGA